MGKKTTITLDSELRNKLYIMKKKCNMNSMEEIIDVLFEATDEVKIKDYVKNVTKRLRKELIELYNFDLDVVEMLNLNELKTAIHAQKRELSAN